MLGIMLYVCVCRISLDGKGNVLYPVLSSCKRLALTFPEVHFWGT